MDDRVRQSLIFRRLEAFDDKGSFDCGIESLNEFFKKYAGQNQRLSIEITYVSVLPDQNRIVGYYTLSSGSIQFQNMPTELSKKLPRYPVPVVRIGRLARDSSVKGQGLGTLLLMNACERILRISEELGIHGIEVDAKDEKAKRFYQSFGFQELLDDELHLYISLKVIRSAFVQA